MRSNPLMRALATASCAAALLLALVLPVHAEPPRLTLDDITEESIDTIRSPRPLSTNSSASSTPTTHRAGIARASGSSMPVLS